MQHTWLRSLRPESKRVEQGCRNCSWLQKNNAISEMGDGLIRVRSDPASDLSVEVHGLDMQNLSVMVWARIKVSNCVFAVV